MFKTYVVLSSFSDLLDRTIYMLAIVFIIRLCLICISFMTREKKDKNLSDILKIKETNLSDIC
jgi:preprotein translocase subunit SecG